ncbi:uncharacterized protein Dmoj_GI21152, isoform C [Drosophila mojavensis]|uniref:vitamin-K-epoxide reductase (warfarin-sensitive) n=1 Tax=Drosophila mojavensis TaxID=7230 RepID=A0A0Q9XAK7_DROMO|nr:uncharacterized protein Dmoj_GI21152, isoform C [Drosophila mojavensis]
MPTLRLSRRAWQLCAATVFPGLFAVRSCIHCPCLPEHVRQQIELHVAVIINCHAHQVPPACSVPVRSAHLNIYAICEDPAGPRCQLQGHVRLGRASELHSGLQVRVSVLKGSFWLVLTSSSSSFGRGFGLTRLVFDANSTHLHPSNGSIGIAFYTLLLASSFFERRWLCQLQLLFAVLTLVLCVYLGGLLLLVLNDCCVVCVLIYGIHMLLLTEVYGRYKRLYLIKRSVE